MGVSQAYMSLLAHLGPTSPVSALSAPDPKNLIVMRHDVDHDMDVALAMATYENRQNSRATYYLLHTEEYWNEPQFIDKALTLQDLGHEVGIHTNLLTQWFAGEIDDVAAELSRVLGSLRGAGLQVSSMAAHGDRSCYQNNFANYWLFSELRGNDPATAQHGISAEGIRSADEHFALSYPSSHSLQRADGATLELWSLSMAEFGLDLEAVHAGHDRYFSDSGGGWTRTANPVDERLETGRHQVLVHPVHWRGSREHVIALSCARSGSTWLAANVDVAGSHRGVHEFTLNHRFKTELDPEHHTGAGFVDVIKDEALVEALLRASLGYFDDQGDDLFEANVYLVHVLPQLLETFKGAQLLHLYRDPLAVTRSLVERDWFDTPRDDRHPAPPIKNFAGMSQVQRCAAYVRWVNDLLLSVEMPRLKLEEISSSPELLAEKLAEVGVAFYPRLTTDFGEVRNESRVDADTRQRLWTADAQKQAEQILRSQRVALGYDVRLRSRLAARLSDRGVSAAVQPKEVSPASLEPITLTAENAGFAVGLAAECSDGHLELSGYEARNSYYSLRGSTWSKASKHAVASPVGMWFELTALIDVKGPEGCELQLFFLGFGSDGLVHQKRRLGPIMGPGQHEMNQSFAPRADISQFDLALWSAKASHAEVVAVSDLLLTPHQ